eukprot:m.195019 g.195019  ORF g.195019 m.195019 type:complete len:2186 (-) comp32545_c1_seq1:652-7209(-)
MMWSRVLVAISLISVAVLVRGQDNPIQIQKVCDGFNQPCTIELVEGFDQWITLSLDDQIICPECSDCSTIYECSVVVNFTVVHAPGSDDTVPANEILNVDPCYVRWTKDEYRHTKRVRISAKTSYRHTSKIKLIVASGVVSRSPYYATREPGDLYVESIDRGTATCSSVGDPHYTSFDGRYWNYYDSGVTTLYRAIDREFLVQTRTHINSRWPSNSVNCQIGGREGRDVVTVSFCSGEADLVTDFNSEDPESHPVVDVRGSSYSVYFHSGAYFHVSWTGYYMNINVGGVDVNGRSCGLCGDADGNPGNDKTGSLRSVGGLDACSKSPSIVPGGYPTDQIDSIFDWVYDEDDFAPETYETPEGGSDCPYALQSMVKPIVATDDIEDITEQLERLQEDRRNGGGAGGILILDDEDDDADDADGDGTDLTGLTDEQLIQQCEAACNQEAVLQCTALYPEFGDQYTEEMVGCKDDIKDMGEGATGGQIDTFLTGINSAIVELCITFVIREGDETDSKLTQLLCNGAKKGCGDHGSCAPNASCICEANWAGTDCTVDLLTPPGIRAISDLVYDVRGLIPGRSPSEIVIYGTNFHKNNDAVCRWGNPAQDPCTEDDPECFAAMTTRAYYAGVGTFICFVPTFGEDQLVDNALFRRLTGQEEFDAECEGQTCFDEFEHNGVNPLAMDFAISNNGKDFSDPSRFPFKYFDSKCVNCTAAGNCAPRTSGSCVVVDKDDATNTKCFLEGETSEDNDCFECLPDVSTTDLVYTFAPKQCKPKFINRVAMHDIFGSAQAGDVIIKGCGDSTLGDDEQCVGVDVSTIDGAEVKYIYEAGSDRVDNCKDQGFEYDSPPVYFTVSEDTGAILLKEDINIDEDPFIGTAHGADHPCLFSGDFNVKAEITVGAGNAKRSYTTTLSYTHVIIDLLPAEYGAIAFDKGGFNGTIPENAPNGAAVLDLEGKPLIVKLSDEPRFDGVEGNFKWAAQSIVGAFAVNADTGAVTVADSTLVDREARDNGRFNPATGMATSVVEASLGFGYHIEDVRILITNVNEAATSAYANCTDILNPCDFSRADNYFELPENTPVGVNLAVLESEDPENAWDADNWKSFDYVVTDPEDVLEAVLDQGVWMLRAKKSLNFESDKKSWTIVLKSVDTRLAGAAAEVSTTITIKLADVNEPPSDPIVTSTNAGVVVDGTTIKVSESVPSRTPLASVTSTDPDVGDADGLCSGFCGIIVDGVLNIDESAQAACPFFVTNDGNVERKVTLCLDNDNTRSDLAFIFQCTFEGSEDVVESQYTIVVEDSDSDEAKIKTFTPVDTAYVVENQEDEGNVERNSDVVIGTVYITDETRDISDPFVESTDKSRFTFDYEVSFGEPLYVISDFTPSIVDGVVGVTLEISLLQDAFVDKEELDCDGCFDPAVEDCDGDECHKVPVLMSIDGTSLENCIADDERPFMRVINTQDAPSGLNCGFFDPTCQNIKVPENAVVGTSVVNFTVVDDDPSDYTVTLSQGSPFTVTKIATGGERRRALYSVYELTVTDVDALLASDGKTISFSVTVEEKGQGGATVTLPLKVAVSNVPFTILPLTSLGSPALFSYSYCGANSVKAYVEKEGISAATYPAALTRYENTITWSVTYEDVDGDWLTLTPSANTLEVNMSITPGKTPPLDGEYTLSAISTVPNTDPTAQEFTFTVDAPSRYAPKFAKAVYNATVAFEVVDDVESQVTDQNTFPKITVSDFDTTTGVGHKLTVSVVTLTKLSSLDTQGQATATFEGRIVYEESLCTQTNRFVSAVGYTGTAEVLVWTVVGKFDKTDCTEVFVNPESMDCTPVYFAGTPNVNISAGEISPAFKAGAFIMANWKDTSSAYNTLSSFAPFSVTAVDVTEEIIEVIGGDTVLGAEDNSKGSVGLIVGIVVLLLVCVLLIAATYFWRQQRKTKHDELFDGKGVSIYDQNPAYAQDNEVLYESNTDWVPGVTNPMYDWYRPDMTRKDCTDHLNQLGEGAYIVRDSDANPGWHMLGIKSQNRVLHDKIRLTENDEYQLLPSVGNASSVPQPTFSDLPELVGYYEQGHDGMEYTLVGSNPIYDNHQLQQERGGTLVKSNNASNLPAKNREYAAVGRLANDEVDDSVGNPLYFDSNNADNATYSQADGYLDVKGLPTQGYLDVDPNTAQGTQGYLDVDPVTGMTATGGYMDVPVNPAHDSL